VKVKKYLFILVALLVFSISLVIVNLRVQAPFTTPYVKVYVDQPLGYIPFVAWGGNFRLDIFIEISGIPDNSPQGIVAWGMTVCYNPDVLELMRVRGETAGYLLYDFADGWAYPYPMIIPPQPPYEGCVAISEAIMSTPPGGAGDPWSGWKLVTLDFRSKNETRPCLIDLKNAEYMTPDGVWHIVDIVVDGFYGATPTYMSSVDTVDLANPNGTLWHENYPSYCTNWNLTRWVDNGNGILGRLDQIGMIKMIGWQYWYYVETVSTTIHWTFKDGPFAALLGDAEPSENQLMNSILLNPIGSCWHQIYPEYSRWFKITAWEDNGDNEFNPSDQFAFEYEDEPGVTYWGHLDDVTTDILLMLDLWSSFGYDLYVEGIVLPYFPLVYHYVIYPNPPLEFGYKINATVRNLGEFDTGSFNVSFTVYLEGQKVPEYGGKKTVYGLMLGERENVSFYFFPEDYGNYTLVIKADCDNDVPETDETNNVKATWVMGTVRGDVDGDGDVDWFDFGEFAQAYGRKFEQPPYHPADFNYDGAVDWFDFGILAQNFGKTV
jgi:hypothetical protein